jgi:hypothetical protein
LFTGCWLKNINQLYRFSTFKDVIEMSIHRRDAENAENKLFPLAGSRLRRDAKGKLLIAARSIARRRWLDLS